jgi:3-phytase
MARLLLVCIVAALLQSPPIEPTRATVQVPNDPDDPAIWIHPQDASKSLILGTDKIAAEGGLYVFDLNGGLRQSFKSLDRPNNVDVEYGFNLGGQRIDIAVVTERKQHRLRVFGIDAGGAVRDLQPAGVPVLAGQVGDASEPMGIALYRRPKDGAVFAIVAPKIGDATNYLWQYRLEFANGAVAGRLVRRFGAFSQKRPNPLTEGEIEAVVADDALGFVYYSDEQFGIRKWHADPDHPNAATEINVLGRDGYRGDREGLAIYASGPDGAGFLISSDQVENGTRLMIYPRDGSAQPLLAAVPTRADETDGLEVTSRSLPGFPNGMLVMMNSSPKNFLIFDWRAVASVIPAADRRRGARLLAPLLEQLHADLGRDR